MSSLIISYLAVQNPDALVGAFLCALVAIPVGIAVLLIRDKFSKGSK